MRFLRKLKEVMNQKQSRAIVLTGNIHDLFFDGEKYVTLIECLSKNLVAESSSISKGITQLVYKLNNPIEIRGKARSELEKLWNASSSKSLENRLQESVENVTFALELMRQITECNRRNSLLSTNLVIMIEAADLLIPDAPISAMNVADRKRIAIVHDWFCDPAFTHGGDTVVMISESRSSIHQRISRLPQVLSIDVPLPDLETRNHYLSSLDFQKEWSDLAESTAGLSLYAIRQLMLSRNTSPTGVSAKIEEYMVSQLGEGTVEFKRPVHTFEDVVGFSNLKKFFREELLPSFKNDGKDVISGAAVCGPIGVGKTFICEAFASELGVPVITLKNIRSKWFGETDMIFERIRRLISSFHKVVIFVDEADTQFGSVSGESHETERRLTGKIQAMMSDNALRGKVIWFLMTARIHLLSPDIRRPGRMDLIIPVLDPEGSDREEFIRWAFCGLTELVDHETISYMATKSFSAAAFGMLRTQIKIKGCKSLQEAIDVAQDMLSPDIEETREYQTLQAKINCTRRSLLESGNIEELRRHWRQRIRELEARGIL